MPRKRRTAKEKALGRVEPAERITLSPEEMAWAVWNPLPPAPVEPMPDFDMAWCLAQMKLAGARDYQWRSLWGYATRSRLADNEGQFWLTVLLKHKKEIQSLWHSEIPESMKQCWHCGAELYRGLAEEAGSEVSAYCTASCASSFPCSVTDAITGTTRMVGRLEPVAHGRRMFVAFLKELSSINWDETITFDLDDVVTYCGTLSPEGGVVFTDIVTVLCAGLTPPQVVQLALRLPGEQAAALMSTWRTFYRPCLSQEEFTQLQSECREHLRCDGLAYFGQSTCWSAYTVAASLRMSDVILEMIENIESEMDVRIFHTLQDRFLYLFSLPTPEQVEMHSRRLRLSLLVPALLADLTYLLSAKYVKAWIACTGFSGLDLVGEVVASADSKESAEKFFGLFDCVDGPAVVPVICNLLDHPYIMPYARHWLLERPAWSVNHLFKIVREKRGAPANIARDVLQVIRSKLPPGIIDDGLAESLRALSPVAGENLPELDEATTPSWLDEVLRKLKPGTGSLPEWADPAVKPRILINGRRLTVSQMTHVLYALKQSTLEDPHELVREMQKNIPRCDADRFAWSLCEAWLNAGADSKDRWALSTVGLLGGDESVLRLTPLLRAWPGQSQHPRAVLGLECLRAIGTDLALMHINGLAQKLKFKALQRRAAKCIEEIAHNRGMTREQLEDRVVPDCGLDENGKRDFDFGSRQFSFVLLADMKPMIREISSGKLRPDLPDPTAKDDPDKVQVAMGEWKLLKQQLKEVARVQCFRLEQAMITGRKWSVTEFELLLARHPLMSNIVRMLVWGAFSATGNKPVQCFRMEGPGCYSDENDRSFNLDPDAEVAVVHPLSLPAETLARWVEQFSDYEIIQPFAQLGRRIFELTSEERMRQEITRFANCLIPGISIVGTLDRKGWSRGLSEDHGWVRHHRRFFPTAHLTAVVCYAGVSLSDISSAADQGIVRCYFVTGHLDEYNQNQTVVSLAAVDPIVVSEVLADLIAISSKSLVTV